MEEGPIAEEEKKGGNNEKKREGKKREEESSSPRRGGCCWLGRTYLGGRATMTKEREGIVRGEERRKKQREGEERGGIGYRYVDRSLLGTIAKIDRRRSIEGEIGRRRSIEGKKGKKKKKKRKRRKEEGRRKKYLTPSLPVDRLWVVAALARTRFFSHARRRNVSPCREKDRGD
ncbi:hypothetical protein B296_00053874, partial [Ensete ventricosum]